MPNPSRGAALGRRAIHGEPEGAIVIRRVYLDPGGYDRLGTYFGAGAPLWWYADEGGELDVIKRGGHDAEAEAAELRDLYPGVPVTIGPPEPAACWGRGDGPCPDGADAEEDSEYCEDCQLIGCDGVMRCDDPDPATCGNCERSWCDRCDPSPSALCHYCHGRGYSTAPLDMEGE